MARQDAHHIIHSRRSWEIYPEGKAIRSTPSLIPRLDRELHEEIHANVPPVPSLGWFVLCRVGKNFYPSRNTLDTMDELSLAIDHAANSPGIHEIERGVAQLAIEAIQLQKPFVAEGLIVPDTRTIIDLKAAA